MNVPLPRDPTPDLPVVHIVDDDPAIRSTVVEVLELSGIAAESFGSGADVLGYHGNDRPDLVIVDQQLPDTTGIDLSIALRSEDPDLAVILLTGYASADNAIAAVGLVDDYLTKPARPEDLVRSVKAGLERARLRRENRHLVGRLHEMNAALEETVAERTSALEMFTYAVAHDLRAPLRAMNGFSEALIEDCWNVLGEDGRDYAGRIQAASSQMGKLIEALLDLSRVSRAEMNLQTIDLGAEASQIAEELQRIGPDRDVRFVIQQPVWALADPTLMATVLQNLLDNAWKYSSRRDGALIEFATIPAGDFPACYYVRDNGAGFDSAYVDKLFIPFQRLHTPGEFPGTGIGLASLRQIVERHGGQVWAEGAVGEGATFYFTLDAKQDALANVPLGVWRRDRVSISALANDHVTHPQSDRDVSILGVDDVTT
ncbi:MAG TPA: response regulator [Streptosporangiaceae bacterium]|nr:response regulator [Streptosporangiaceae bacterium]